MMQNNPHIDIINCQNARCWENLISNTVFLYAKIRYGKKPDITYTPKCKDHAGFRQQACL